MSNSESGLRAVSDAVCNCDPTQPRFIIETVYIAIMSNTSSPSSGRTAERTETLSTGHTVELPVRTRATMLGATFAAPRADVSELLPDRLRPIRATPTGAAAVTLLSVEYHEVAIPEMDPYDEFVVGVPASHTSPSTVPYVSALTQATNGYVRYMPVTTEPARAFGAEIWGFPKVVADITHDDDGSVRTTTVTVDGERFLTLAVDRPPSTRMTDDGFSYTVKDGRLLEVPNGIDAEVGGWPFTNDVSVSFGDHPEARPLDALGLGPRALGRVSLDGTACFYPGRRV